MGRRSRRTRRWIRTAPTGRSSVEILREAEETDRREDELYGDARGDELPEPLRTAEGRRAALQEAKRRIEERKGRAVAEDEPAGDKRRGGSGRVGQWWRAVGANGRGRGAVSWTAAANASVARSRATGRIGCLRPSDGSRRATRWTWPPTRPMRAGGRPHATGSGGGCTATTASHGWRRRCRTGRSTSPIRTPG